MTHYDRWQRPQSADVWPPLPWEPYSNSVSNETAVRVDLKRMLCELATATEAKRKLAWLPVCLPARRLLKE